MTINGVPRNISRWTCSLKVSSTFQSRMFRRRHARKMNAWIILSGVLKGKRTIRDTL